MKEKKFLHWMLVRSMIIIVSFLIALTVLKMVLPNELKESSLNLSNAAAELSGNNELSMDDLEFRMDVPNLFVVKSVEQRAGKVFLTMEPTMEGSGETYLEVIHKATGTIMESTVIKVAENGLLMDTQTGNFSNYRENQLCITIMILAFAALLWAGYFKSKREMRFSYHSIFCIGLAVWVTVLGILLVKEYAQDSMMLNIYGALADTPKQFAYLTFPFVLVYAVLLSVSNISLIRHEGFRFTDVLGILISVLMVVGFIALALFDNLFWSGSSVQMDIWNSVVGLLYCVYVILECFLLGAIICGTKAAKNRPAFDKDYIVILGCMIRSDGTLYPLIRGRVDRAISFYKDQLEATGKKAVFIPSGGKGDNEPISEAEAMRRYLIEQGIRPEQIVLEDQSVNTIENMQFSKRLIGENAKTVFSTTNYHVFRSGIISNQVGFEADGMGCRTKWYYWPNAYIREVIGMLSYKWKALAVILILIAAFLTVFRFAF